MNELGDDAEAEEPFGSGCCRGRGRVWCSLPAYGMSKVPMKTLLVTYIVAYALVVGGMLLVYTFLVPAEEKTDDHWWTIPVDTLLAVVTFVGMLLLYTQAAPASIKTAWKVVAPALVAIQLYLNIDARVKHMRETGDMPDAESRAGDIAMLVFIVPALALNLVYAFGS